jgi:hypothetical protein
MSRAEARAFGRRYHFFFFTKTGRLLGNDLFQIMTLMHIIQSFLVSTQMLIFQWRHSPGITLLRGVWLFLLYKLPLDPTIVFFADLAFKKKSSVKSNTHWRLTIKYRKHSTTQKKYKPGVFARMWELRWPAAGNPFEIRESSPRRRVWIQALKAPCAEWS